MIPTSRLAAELSSDIRAHYSSVSTVRRSVYMRALFNPSIHAATLARVVRNSTGLAHQVGRWWLLTRFAIDVASGPPFGEGLNFPHPLGIVIGSGVKLGRNATIYQNCTLGASGDGGYPVIGDGVTLYPGSVVAGSIEVGARARVSANSLVLRNVAPGETFKANGKRD